MALVGVYSVVSRRIYGSYKFSILAQRIKCGRAGTLLLEYPRGPQMRQRSFYTDQRKVITGCLQMSVNCRGLCPLFHSYIVDYFQAPFIHNRIILAHFSYQSDTISTPQGERGYRPRLSAKIVELLDFGGGEGAVVDADVVEGAVKKLLFPCVKSLAQRALRRFVILFQRKYEALFGGQLPSSDGLTQ